MTLSAYKTTELIKEARKRAEAKAKLRAKLQGEFSLEQLEKAIKSLDKNNRYLLREYINPELEAVSGLFSDVKTYKLRKEQK